MNQKTIVKTAGGDERPLGGRYMGGGTGLGISVSTLPQGFQLLPPRKPPKSCDKTFSSASRSEIRFFGKVYMKIVKPALSRLI